MARDVERLNVNMRMKAGLHVGLPCKGRGNVDADADVHVGLGVSPVY